MKFPDFLQILFLGRRGRLLFIKGKAVYEDFYEEKSPRAKGKAVIKIFIKGNAVLKTFIKGTGRAQRESFLNRSPLVCSRNCSRSHPKTVENRSPLVEVQSKPF